jgi:hypothetical protein
MASTEEPSDQENTAMSIDKCIDLLQSHKIKLIAFDMDQTAVAMHSRGKLRREELDEYIAKATPAFKELVPALHAQQLYLAIATHSDEAEFKGEIQPETHILGKELATALVNQTFSEEIASSFFVVAYNPRWHAEGQEEENKIKRYHMRELQRHFGVEANEILFLDDTPSVVEDCIQTCGVRTIQIDPERAFRLSDILDNLTQSL